MAKTLTYTGQLVVVTCWCGIAHAIPDDLNRWASKDTSNAVFCPLGHKWVNRTSEATRLRAQLDQAKADARWEREAKERARADAEHQSARARGYKGALTKTKKRIAAGVCPCCNRSFVDLSRHMHTQHPGYSDEATDA